ncbi:MAG: glycosyltransferase [Chloroflexi bacterium]|nr:glycosyltransferase [Chloroflexota bacterium]
MAASTRPRRVLIYRDELLPFSETFILAQSGALHRYDPFFVGSRRVPGLLVAPDRSLALEPESRPARLVFRAAKLLGGISPASLERVRRLDGALLHAHFGHDAVYALPIVERLRLPFVVTFHGYDLARAFAARLPAPGGAARHAHAAWVERRYPAVFARAQRVLAASGFLASRLAALGCPPEKIRVHHIGVDVQSFSPPPEETPPQPVVLFIGRLVEKKGLEWLIRAMSIVQAAEPRLRLVVAGDGPLRPSLERMAAGSLRSIEFLGRLESKQIRNWLARAALLCVPSVQTPGGDVEGIPLAVLEAQAMGVPVVASDHAGIPEAVYAGETGLLVAERDYLGLAAAILRLWRDPALRQRLAAAARRQVERDFSLQRNTAALEDLYDEILNS